MDASTEQIRNQRGEKYTLGFTVIGCDWIGGCLPYGFTSPVLYSVTSLSFQSILNIPCMLPL